MPRAQPILKLHTRGVWFCHWGNRDWYFTKDERKSRRAFLDPKGAHPGALVHWLEWSEQRERARTASRAAGGLAIAEVFDAFMQARVDDITPDSEIWYRKHLGPLVRQFGRLPAMRFTLRHADALKIDLGKMWGPTSVGHTVTAMKTMCRWAARRGLMPLIDFSDLRPPPRPRPKVKGYGPETVKWQLRIARRTCPELQPWIALSWFGLLRPSEVPRLVRGEGHWLPGEDGVFVLERSKTERRGDLPRHCVLSEQALIWLSVARPAWRDYQAYGQAFRRFVGPGGPHPLRHGAAWHLARLGVARGEIDLLLGHSPGRVSLTYNPSGWQSLRALAARLAL